MSLMKNAFLFLGVISIVGCSHLHSSMGKGTVLPRTNTAIVGIYIDKNGYPQANVDQVDVHPGQKIVFAGPDRFDILFKDQRSPIDSLEVSSSNGVVTIQIPRDIFEKNRRAKTTVVDVKELLYRYGIRVNDKITDPTIRISPGND